LCCEGCHQSTDLCISKVPNIREGNTIGGVVKVTAATLTGTPIQGCVVLPLRANVVIPRIICNRLLPLEETKVVRLAVKLAKNQDTKIPFRNCGSTTL
jgi:hypothetical protein